MEQPFPTVQIYIKNPEPSTDSGKKDNFFEGFKM